MRNWSLHCSRVSYNSETDTSVHLRGLFQKYTDCFICVAPVGSIDDTIMSLGLYRSANDIFVSLCKYFYLFKELDEEFVIVWYNNRFQNNNNNNIINWTHPLTSCRLLARRPADVVCADCRWPSAVVPSAAGTRFRTVAGQRPTEWTWWWRDGYRRPCPACKDGVARASSASMPFLRCHVVVLRAATICTKCYHVIWFVGRLVFVFDIRQLGGLGCGFFFFFLWRW